MWRPEPVRRRRRCSRLGVAELPSLRRWLHVEQAWSYANAGYWLVGALCARRADSTFEDALTARVLHPLGLESTSFDEPDVPGTGKEAIDGPYPRARRPSGGLTSTVEDLIRFGQRHLDSPDGARMRIVHGKPAAGVYGLGLWGERVGGVEVWGHPGSYGGFQTSFLVIPDRDAVFVGLTNSSRGANALHEIENTFFERVIGERRPRPRLSPCRRRRARLRRHLCQQHLVDRRRDRGQRPRADARRRAIDRPRVGPQPSRSRRATACTTASTSRSRDSAASAAGWQSEFRDPDCRGRTPGHGGSGGRDPRRRRHGRRRRGGRLAGLVRRRDRHDRLPRGRARDLPRCGIGQRPQSRLFRGDPFRQR